MKKYNVIEKKKGTLLLSIITFDKKVDNTMKKTFKKIKRQCDVVEVNDHEKKRC